MADRVGQGRGGRWPTVTFAARVAGDGRVHVVIAPADAMVDPTTRRTCCQRPVTRLHGRPHEITCAECAAVSGVRPRADFPPRPTRPRGATPTVLPCGRRGAAPLVAPMVALTAAAAVALAGCTAEPGPAGPAPTAATPVPLPEPVGSTADVVERVAPSVVTVRVDGGGLGSGVVYRPDVVLTNQHVVGDARDVTIDYADGTSSPGTVLGTDATTDLAVVRTARTGLPVPEYRTELPRPGDPVLAIGSPLGLEGTVTAGIVAASDREIPGSAAQSRALVEPHPGRRPDLAGQLRWRPATSTPSRTCSAPCATPNRASRSR